VWVRIEGQGIPGTADEVQTCHILVNRFNSKNRQWADAEPRPNTERENGVDVVARHLHGGERLRFQVTRVDPDPKVWSDLGKKKRAEKIYRSVDTGADVLYEAISKKLHRPQEKIILVLNATQLPIGLSSVRDSSEKRHGAWLRGLKFEEVWVVESFHDDAWTCQLFKKGT
jgi:hypothetical protein